MQAQCICSVEGCEKPVVIKKRGWCSAHYQRWYAHGDPLAGGPSRSRRPMHETCTVDGCEDPTIARGYCEFHYGRWSKHGDPSGGGPRRLRRGSVETCTVEGCSRSHRERGYCGMHLQRVRRYGSPGSSEPRSRGFAPSMVADYRIVPTATARCMSLGCDQAAASVVLDESTGPKVQAALGSAMATSSFSPAGSD